MVVLLPPPLPPPPTSLNEKRVLVGLYITHHFKGRAMQNGFLDKLGGGVLFVGAPIRTSLLYFVEPISRPLNFGNSHIHIYIYIYIHISLSLSMYIYMYSRALRRR